MNLNSAIHPRIRQELDGFGRWEIRHGGRHTHILVGGKIAMVVSRGSHSRNESAPHKVEQQLRYLRKRLAELRAQ
jgi:hypothetical protein